MRGSMTSVTTAVCAALVTGAAFAAPSPVVATPGVAPHAPPDTSPDPGATAFERLLAELSFGTFLTIELGVDPGTFTCTEPPTLDDGETITCFALLDDGRVIVATTTVSGASGVFEFDVVADYTAADETPATVSTATTQPSVTGPPTTFSSADVTEANIAILLYGDSLNAIAENEKASVINAADGSVTAVNVWAWDPTAASFTVDLTLNADLGMDLDASAWVTVTNLAVHWEVGQPFREPAAFIRPILVVVISGQRYVSGWELANQVADQTIAMDDWVAAARQP